MDPLLNGLHIAIFVTDGFEQAELTEPKQALEREGAITKIVSDRRGKVTAGDRDAGSAQFDIDITFDEADPKDFDAVVLCGGSLDGGRAGSMVKAQDFVRSAEEEGKPIAAIGRGVWLLLSSALVRERTLTSAPAMQDDIRNAGGNWIDREAVVDGNLVTGRTAGDVSAFNQKMIEVMSEKMQASLRGKPDAHAVGIATS